MGAPFNGGLGWESEDAELSPNAMVAQAAAFGSHAVLAQQAPASDSVRLEPKAKPELDPKVDGELTEAPIEDDVMQGGEHGGAEDEGER